MRKRTTSVCCIIMCVLALLLCACESGYDGYYGEWQIEISDDIDTQKMTVELREDGTCTMRYYLDGIEEVPEDPEDEEYKYVIVDDPEIAVEGVEGYDYVRFAFDGTRQRLIMGLDGNFLILTRPDAEKAKLENDKELLGRWLSEDAPAIMFEENQLETTYNLYSYFGMDAYSRVSTDRYGNDDWGAKDKCYYYVFGDNKLVFYWPWKDMTENGVTEGYEFFYDGYEYYEYGNEYAYVLYDISDDGKTLTLTTEHGSLVFEK